MIESAPTLTKFSPDVIPYQREVCDLVRDYNFKANGVLEVLLSGSYGSAKSTLMAHLVIRHCMEYAGARVCLARRSLPDLKKTIWREVLDHFGDDLIEGKHYFVNRSEMRIRFVNGSEIICASWADKRYKKFRSLKISFLAVEEAVENDEEDYEAYKQLFARLGRITGIPVNLVMLATNPDAPGHWVYRRIIAPNSNGTAHTTRRVFYSRTEDNPFLDPTYIKTLRESLSPKEAERYLHGKWVELSGEVIYYAYRSEVQYRKTEAYQPDKELPIWLTFDFNIAQGKPMSAVMFQYLPKTDTFHFFNESVIHGARTADIIDEWDGKGLLLPSYRFALTGDSAGKHRDTRSSRSDYDIILQELGKRNLQVEYCVPICNPPIRTRHNRVNAYCLNEAGQTRLYLYQGCKMLDDGLRLVKLKKGGNYIEDDGPACPWQHVTTALGYGILAATNKIQTKSSGVVRL